MKTNTTFLFFGSVDIKGKQNIKFLLLVGTFVFEKIKGVSITRKKHTEMKKYRHQYLNVISKIPENTFEITGNNPTVLSNKDYD